MNKTFLLFALAAAVVAVSAGPSYGFDQVNDCPVAIGNPNIVDPWARVAIGDPNVRLADRNGDGIACAATVRVSRVAVATLWTDNSIGNPHLIPPGPCTDPFREVGIGDPNLIGDPGIRQIDANGDGNLCASAQLEARGLILILLDNPNAIGDPHL